MSLGTKNRQARTAKLCKQRLREKHRDKIALVEEYIGEIEGTGKQKDVTRWGQFTDAKGIYADMLKRLDDHFETWLNP
jgi:hypothetical protein